MADDLTPGEHLAHEIDLIVDDVKSARLNLNSGHTGFADDDLQDAIYQLAKLARWVEENIK